MSTPIIKGIIHPGIEGTLITTKAVVNVLLHNFQSDDSQFLPIGTVAGLLAQIDDNIELLFQHYRTPTSHLPVTLESSLSKLHPDVVTLIEMLADADNNSDILIRWIDELHVLKEEVTA